MIFENDLDAVLQDIIARWEIPGLAVGLIEDQEIVYSRGFGVQSLATRTPVSLDTVFCVASISKTFVATAVMQWAERGKIDLDASIVQYLPYFQMADERYRQITIRQMLSHTSGMPDMDEIEYAEWMTRPEWDEGAAERYIRQLSNKKLSAKPGERFNYTNIAYNVLGGLIARVAGKSFESSLREQILIPAGMPNSTFLLAEVPPGLLAVPHLRAPKMRVSPIYPYQRADAPASFLHATLVDMCHWGITTLNQGRFHGQILLSPASYQQMWTPVAEWGYPPPSIYEQIGLGWTLGHYHGARTISHGGMGFGWTDFLLIIPEKKRAAVILCNEESFARSRTVQAVAQVLMDLKPQVNPVSWMVPISQALAEGGIQAAYARSADLKTSSTQDYYFAEDELVNLSFQLITARETDLAIDVLELNSSVFPRHSDTYLEMAKIFLHKGEFGQAQKSLLKALSIEPNHAAVLELLENIVLQALAELEIRYTIREHPPVYTVAQARQYDGEGAETHVKNLFLRSRRGERHYLLIARESLEIDLKGLALRLGETTLGLASPARLLTHLGVQPGAVGPFGLLYDSEQTVVVLVDAALAGVEAVGFHPNINTATLVLAGVDLMKFLRWRGNRVEVIEVGKESAIT